MADASLTTLQVRLLELLADVTPRWTLSGGAALAGFHLRHRSTRDLDLFWHGAREIRRVRDDIALRLLNAGLKANTLVSGAGFSRIEVCDGKETVVLDLVADPVPIVDSPVEMTIGSRRIQVDSAHEILVNKLCTLLSRQEVRDLVDVRQLALAGGDLWRAVAQANQKDGGFSPQVLAWLLRGFPLRPLAEKEGASAAEIEALEGFRDDFVADLLRRCKPDD